MRRRRTLLLLVALLALLAWLVWWLGRDATAPDAVDDAVPVASAIDAGDASSPTATRPRTTRRRRSRTPDEPAGESAAKPLEDQTLENPVSSQ